MKIISLVYLVILIALINLAGGADYGPINMREGANITLDGGFITGQSTDMYVSPMTFGAVGDGVTDDIEALNDTVVYARSHNLTVLLPMRTFYTTQPLNLTTGDTILGLRGSYAIPQNGFNINGSCLFYDGSDCAINITDPDGDYIYKVTLRDFVIKSANNQQAVGIKCTKLSEFEFSNLDMREFNTNIYADDLTIGLLHNLHLNGAITALNLDIAARLTVEHCNFWNNTVGIRTRALYASVIRENQFEQCGVCIAPWSYGENTCSDTVSVVGNNFRSSTTTYAGTGVVSGVGARVLNINDSASYTLTLDRWIFRDNSVYFTGVDYLINFSLNSGSTTPITIENCRLGGQNLTVCAVDGTVPVYLTWNANTLNGGTGIETGDYIFVAGLSDNLFDYQNFSGGIQLPVDKEVWHDGCIWYDSASDTVKVRSNGINKVLAFVT